MERYWPGVTEADAARLDASLQALEDGPVRYLGSVLMLGDEVMLARFEGGTAAEVEAAARRARTHLRPARTRHISFLKSSHGRWMREPSSALDRTRSLR